VHSHRSEQRHDAQSAAQQPRSLSEQRVTKYCEQFCAALLIDDDATLERESSFGRMRHPATWV